MSDDETSSHSSQSSLSIDDEIMPENVIRPYQYSNQSFLPAMKVCQTENLIGSNWTTKLIVPEIWTGKGF